MTDLLKIHPEINTSTTYYSSRELNNTVYRISAVIENIEQPIVSFIHLTSCTPYHIVLERPVVSIDYLFYDLYDEAVFADDIQDRVDAKCKIQYLSQIQQAYYKAKNISELAVSPFQRFIIKCKGPYQHNIKVEILNRWLDRVNGKDKVIREWTSTHRIRKIPRDEIPGECQGKGKDVCKYPCAWNKFVGLCTGIPKGIYRPDEADPDMIRQYIGDGMEEEI
jgi:hypothetical protein